MPAISVERTIGVTKRAVLAGLIRYNDQKMGKHKYRRFAVSLRDKGAIVGVIDGYPGGVTRHWFSKAL